LLRVEAREARANPRAADRAKPRCNGGGARLVSEQPTIRPAYSNWPRYNQTLRDVVAGMTDAQLATTPGPDRWPLWATIGHAACQRVFWLCDFAGEPGAKTTRFTNAAYNCPGDDDL